MTTREIAGKIIDFDEQGFMSNPNQWDREVATTLANEIGISPLTDRHWQVIEFCRSDYQAQGDAPTLRRITKVGGVPTKELYKLFPKGLAKKVARGGGLPPGWQKKCVVGWIMPPEIFVHCHPLPAEIAVKLPPPPPGTMLVCVSGKVVRMGKANHEILAVVDIN